MIYYHADDSLKVHNSDITTQSKIPLFVFKHLAIYTLAKLQQSVLKQLSQSCYFMRVNMPHALNILPAHFCTHAHTKRCIIADAIAKKESKQVN